MSNKNKMPNLYQLPAEIKDFSKEIFETIVSSNNLRIERIISYGQSNAPNFWYDQNEHEWVLLLKGHAKLEFENHQAITLYPGDYINIPAHQKHRVAYTAATEETVWLAVFYK